MNKCLTALLLCGYLGFFSYLSFAQEIKTEIYPVRNYRADETDKDVSNGVYSKLKNPRCNMVLSECSCPEAKEIKGYIAGLLDAGTDKDDIFYKAAKKFSLKVIWDNEVRQAVEKRLIQEMGENRPKIVLEPADYFDFGKVDKTQGDVRQVFKLHNKGKADLVIKNIRVSCSCTSVSLIKGNEKSPYFGTKGAAKDWQVELKPDESAELEVVLDLNHRSVRVGDLMREVMIASNDPLYPEASVTVKAQVTGEEQGKQTAEAGGKFSGKLAGGVRIIELKASKFKFEPEPIVVKKGERVRLVATSTDVTHGIAIPEYKVNLAIPAGKTASAEFSADKEGSFPTHCSVFCGLGHGKMRGTFVVNQ